MDKRTVALAFVLLMLLPPAASLQGQAAAKTREEAGAASDWELVRELAAHVKLAPGKHYTAWFDNGTAGFGEYNHYPPLTAKARSALNITPAWLHDSLERQFLELGSEMDRYADVMNGASDAKLVDEMAFCIAHTSPDILRWATNAHTLFAENAASVYAADANLSYVRLVEKGDFTTAAYINATGTEVELPKDIYYWFIVHPKISDETPAYINPSNGAMSAPPTGKFWRDYLLNHNDTGYPLLKEALAGVPTMWNGTVNRDVDNGAVGVIIRWVKDVMEFTSDNERPVQPVRIYAKHIGRCGEHEDLTCAAARAALIPCIGAEDFAEDHVWNEFWYDGRWVQWEPVNTMVDTPKSYAAWGKKFPAVNAWRGDDMVWQETGLYTQTCTLRVFVKDRNGVPVEGANIWVGNEYAGDTRFRMYATCNATNVSGVAEFRCGRNNTLYARVDSEKLGGAPTNSITSTGADPYVILGTDTVRVVSNADPTLYNHTFTLSSAIVPKKGKCSEAVQQSGNYKLELSVKAKGSEVKGMNYLVDNHYFLPDGQVPIYSFIAAADQYDRFNLSQDFKGWGFSNSSSTTIESVLPDSGRWHAVVGSDAVSAIQTVEVTVRFYIKAYIAIGSPSDGCLVAEGSVVKLSGSADAADAEKVEVSWDGGGSWRAASFNSSSLEWSCDWNTSGLPNGTRTVVARLVHGGQMVMSDPLKVQIDALDPELTLEASGYMKGGGGIRLEGNATDNVGMARVEVAIAGTGEDGPWRRAEHSNITGRWGLEWLTGALGSGDYCITVRATDLAGRMRMVSGGLTLDFDAPTVTLGTSGLFRAGVVVRLEGNVWDDVRVKDVQVTIKGVTQEANISGGRWTFDWPTEGLPSGKYTLTVMAEDMAGWTANAASTVTLDADAPAMDVDWPDSAEAGSLVELAGNVKDPSGLESCELSLDNGSSWQELELDDGGDWSCRWDTSGLLPGNYSHAVRANDTTGNLGLLTRDIVLVDTTPPTMTIEMVKSIEAGENLSVKVKPQDLSGVMSVELSTDGKEWLPLASSGTKGYLVELDTADLSIGKNRMRVRAFDPYGNMGSAEKDVTVTDEQAPKVAIGNISVVKRTLTSSGSASDNYRLNKLEYTIDGISWLSLQAVNGSWNLTVAQLKYGKGQLRLRASDTSGHTAEQSAEFNVPAPPQPSKGFIPGFDAVLAVLALLGALISVMVKGKRNGQDERGKGGP